MSFARYITGADAVKQVMVISGLNEPPAVAGSNDRTAQQMWQLATEVGQRIADIHDWQVLETDMTITTVIGQTVYPVPADFNGFVSDASWNRTTRLPVIGSLNESEWQMLKARQLEGTTFTMLYRLTDDGIELYDSPSTVQTLVLPYRSRGWVRKIDNSRADTLTDDTDVVLFDAQLFKAALRLAWYEVKEFDTGRLERTYSRAAAYAIAKDRPGRTRTLNQQAAYPYLGVINIPDTGYGNS